VVLSIIFLEDKHTLLLHLSIFHEYQQFFQHRICLHVKEIYVIFIHLFDSGILLIIDLNKKKGEKGGGGIYL
jgi:hypothetical protein